MKTMLWVITVCAYLIAGFLFFGALVGTASIPGMLIACAAGIVGTITLAALTIIDELKAASGNASPPPNA
jgi:hypothetical protein